jgi:membrane protease YdiL (CAAX protease family)
LTTLQTAGTSGFAMALAYLMAAPPTLWLSAYLARLRGIGGSARAYLALRGVGKRRVAFWCVALVVYLFVSDWVLVLLGQSAGAEQMIGFFKNSWFPPLLWFSVVVLAPLTEEVVVRGFMFRGLVHSRVGAWGAVLIPNLAWTALHAYYDLPGMLVVFGAGLMFGWARLRTDSLYPPIAMHLVMNLGATLQVEWLIRSGQLN